MPVTDKIVEIEHQKLLQRKRDWILHFYNNMQVEQATLEQMIQECALKPLANDFVTNLCSISSKEVLDDIIAYMDRVKNKQAMIDEILNQLRAADIQLLNSYYTELKNKGEVTDLGAEITDTNKDAAIANIEGMLKLFEISQLAQTQNDLEIRQRPYQAGPDDDSSFAGIINIVKPLLSMVFSFIGDFKGMFDDIVHKFNPGTPLGEKDRELSKHSDIYEQAIDRLSPNDKAIYNEQARKILKSGKAKDVRMLALSLRIAKKLKEDGDLENYTKIVDSVYNRMIGDKSDDDFKEFAKEKIRQIESDDRNITEYSGYIIGIYKEINKKEQDVAQESLSFSEKSKVTELTRAKVKLLKAVMRPQSIKLGEGLQGEEPSAYIDKTVKKWKRFYTEYFPQTSSSSSVIDAGGFRKIEDQFVKVAQAAAQQREQEIQSFVEKANQNIEELKKHCESGDLEDNAKNGIKKHYIEIMKDKLAALQNEHAKANDAEYKGEQMAAILQTIKDYAQNIKENHDHCVREIIRPNVQRAAGMRGHG